jgi:hypothetical protein
MHSKTFQFIRTPRLRHTSLLAATLGAGLACGTGANVSVSQWNGPTDFHHKRTGIPDQDQKRVGLPNSGSCYCVPTAMMNVLMYVANHGYADVVPGPGNYSGYDTYYDVTDLLEDLGGWADISPGGADPDDPDCNDPGDGQGDGGDGVCESLPCGGKSSKVYEALIDQGWLGNAEDDLVWTSRYHDPNAPPASFQTFAELAFDGQVAVVSFGRYKPVAGSGSNTIFRRSGGHAVTMNEIFRDGANKDLYIRDPGNDSDIFGPSTYTTTKWDITDITFLVTDALPGELLLNWWPETFSAINEPQADGVHRCLDGYMAVAPKTGVFWKDNSFIKKLSLSAGFGPDPIPHPAPFAPVLDLVIDQNNLGWFALLGGTEVALPALAHVNPISGEVTPLVATDAFRLALGDMSEVFSIDQSPPTLRKHDLRGNELASAAIPGVPGAIAYDDATDNVYVFVPSTGGPGGQVLCYPRNFGGASGAPTVWILPGSLMLGTAARMAVNPTDGRLWIASESLDKAFGFAFPTSGSLLVHVETVSGFSALTSVEFDDAGRMYAVSAGSAELFERSSTGAWQSVDAGALAGQDVGDVLRISRSRSNYDPRVQESSLWDNIPGDELEELGQIIPDCVGDLNGDGAVDGGDLGVLLSGWGGTGAADLNGDGVVDGADLGVLLGAWGPCPE